MILLWAISVSPQPAYVEIYPPIWGYWLEDETFRRWLDQEGAALKNRMSALVSWSQRTPLPLPLQWETASMNQEAGSHQTPNLQSPLNWTSQPPELGKTSACCLMHSVYGIFVTAEKTKTNTNTVYWIPCWFYWFNNVKSNTRNVYQFNNVI